MNHDYLDISHQEWQKWKESNPDFVLIDVREKDEFQTHNMGGVNIPAHEINDFLDRLRKFEKIVLVCSDGLRSGIMARVIKKKIPSAEIFHLSEGIFIE